MKIVTIFIILISNITFSQNNISGYIIDKTNNNKIPFATLEFIGKHIGTAADEKGFYTFSFEEVFKIDTITISALGYEKKKIIAKTILENSNIYLIPKIIELKTTFITKTKNKNILVGSRKKIMGIGGLYSNASAISALYIKVDSNIKGTFKTIGVYITRKGKPKGTIRLRLYNVAKDTILPDDDITYEPIYIYGTNGGEWVDVDISKYNIAIPKQGFFIGVENIKTTDDYYYNSVFNQLSYGPVLGHTKEFDKCYTFQKRLGSDWYSVGFGGVYFNLMARARLSVWE